MSNETTRNYRMTYEVPGRRWQYEYDEPTPRGERIAVELRRCDGGSLPRLWHKEGRTSRLLKSWWGVTVYAYDEDGRCFGRYNPTAKPGGDGYVYDFAWVLEATEENKERLFREIERRAFGAN